MSSRFTVMSRLLALVALLTAVGLLSAPTGQAATTWGALGHFGELDSELHAPEAAFGVNPADGTLWTVDTTTVGEEEVFRIQKFEQSGGSWKAVASHNIEATEFEQGKAPVFRTVEGIAFDAASERAYVLVAEESPKTIKEEPVVSELLAFSTKTSGSSIVAATGTKTGGVLVPRTETKLTGSPVGKTEFGPDSTEKGAALVAPGGIAVNPTNHQVIVTGWVGAEKPEVWAVSSEGKIETVWEDKTNFFNGCGCLTAPVVTASGKILVLGDELQEVTELPSTLNSATAPKRAFWLPRIKECEERQFEKEKGVEVEGCPFVESLAQIEDGTEVGDEMSIGTEGDLYIHIHVKNVADGGFEQGAVMVVSPSLEEIGWIGGGSWGGATKACAVNETDPGNLGAALVAGYKEHAFMLERGSAIAGEHAKVLELGPGGSTEGCPLGSAKKPTPEAGGVKLTKFPIADKIALSSEVTQANALSTEWEFEPGVKETVNKRQQAKTAVEHQFANEGTFNVVERIHSDDLATPIIETSEKVTIVAPADRKEEATAAETELTLKAEVNPMGSPTKCEFQLAPAAVELGAAGTKTAACPTNPGEEEKWALESVKFSGLTKGTAYHFRLLTKAGVWQSKQPGVEVRTTEAGAPIAETNAASEVTTTSATLNGKVNPEGTSTSCKFEYGTTLPSGTFVACSSSPGSGKALVAVSAKVGGLTSATAYKFVLIAENTSKQTGTGAPLAFTTLEAAAAPTAETFAATGIGQTGATLKGLVNPHGEATTCKFEYGTSASYGSTVACPTAPGSGKSGVEESIAIGGLSPGTTYHFRIVAESPLGKATGVDKEIRTAAATKIEEREPEKEKEKGGTLPFVEASPAVTVAGVSFSVPAGGAFVFKVGCPANATCTGTVVIKTLAAVAARAHVAKKAILTLATGSFTIAGGTVKTLTLHLSAKAKKLLAKLHTIRAKATIVAHNATGETQIRTALLTFKAAKKKHH